jgi:hypothetical protein
VPEDNKMAVRLVQAEEANRAEKQRLKERVLQIDQLSAEAEVCGLPYGVCIFRSGLYYSVFKPDYVVVFAMLRFDG